MESLDGQAGNINKMVNACNSHNVVPVLSVGGWSYTDNSLCADVFAKNTDTDAKCKSLASSIVTQAKKYNFKGVDIDWEYPNASTKNQYTTFMRELRNLCNANGMSLTIAVAATSNSGITDEVLGFVDFVNIMAYDGDAGAGHSPYSLAENSFKFWNQKVPANKLVIGVPFYERPNWASYEDVVNSNSANAQKDSAIVDGTTVYYNGIPTMTKKAEYAAANAGGIMIWEISQDSKNSSLSLLNAIYNTTVSKVGLAGSTQPATTVAPTTTQVQTTQAPTTKPAVVTNVPGTIAIGSFASKSDGISMETEGTINYAGNLTNGSAIDYNIKATESGEFTLKLKLAAGDAQWNAKNLIVKLNDQTVATVPVQGSTAWTTFIDHTAKITLAAGTAYKLSIVADGGACNVTDMVVEKVVATTAAPTQAPTTAAPTQAPTTVAPTTVAPTTVAPTQVPTTAQVATTLASANKVDKTLLAAKNDGDPKGSTFGKLCAQVRKTTKKSNNIKWSKVPGAVKYVVYGSKCGTKVAKLKTLTNTRFNHNKLKKGTYYKYIVIAIDKDNNVVAISKMIHSATNGGKFGNAKALKVNKTKISLEVGKTFKIKASQIPASKAKIKKHRNIAFESSDEKVATVSKKGIIKAIGKGECLIYVYGQNGVYKKIKVSI